MAGRKSRYETHVQNRFQEIEKWARDGATEAQIAKKLGVGVTTFNTYKSKHEELAAVIKRGRLDVVENLRGALIKKALGYDYTEVKEVTEQMKMPETMRKALIDAGFKAETLDAIQVVRTEVTHKHTSPDVAAINLALKNYDKTNWANDPQMLEIRKEELKLRKKQIENNEW